KAKTKEDAVDVEGKILQRFRLELCSNFITQFIAAFPIDLLERKVEKWDRLDVIKLFEKDWVSDETFFGLLGQVRGDVLDLDTKAAQKIAIKLFSYDLAYTPLRFLAYPEQLVKQKFIPCQSKLEKIKVD